MIRDVKQYYLQMLSQYMELKSDVADYEQAFKDGHFTEDQLNNAKEYVNRAKENLDRVAYIMHLFNLPANKKSKEKYLKINKNIEDYFIKNKADLDSMIEENKELVSGTVKMLKELTEEDK